MSTFYDRFCECAERWPKNIALEIVLRDGIESLTYAELRAMAEAIGSWLTQQKFDAGSRIAILSDNHPRWVAAYLGIIAAGYAAVPLDTAFHADQVAKLLTDSGSSLLFCDRKHLEIARAAIAGPGTAIVLLDGDASGATSLQSILSVSSPSFTPLPVSSESLASLLYTSGTTADPKGVMLTHANILGEVEAVFSWAEIGPDDALLGVLPLFHVLSQMANLLLPLVKGSRVVYLETLNTTDLLRALQDRKITAFAVVPQFFYLIHERIFKEVNQRGKVAERVFRLLMSITRFCRRLGWNPGRIFFPKIHQTLGTDMRYLVTGGSRFDAQIGRDFHALGIDVLQAYGLTETSAAAFATSPRDNVIGSVGKPLKGVEGKIVDPQPNQDLGRDVGEIAIRGAIVMKGYWNRPDATASALKGGWLHTGDLGYFDAGGNLFITGRQKEVIVLSNGKNIYPEEIEAHYLQSPFIKEIAAIGLEGSPGDPFADRLHAVVVPNFEVLRQRNIVNAREVLRYDIESLSIQLPSTKRIGSYEIWQEDLPRTTTRKIKRFEVEKRVRATLGKPSANANLHVKPPLSAEDELWLAQPGVRRAIEIVRGAARTTADWIRPSNNLELDLGLDSMQRVELLVALEKELGGNVDESRLARIYTVQELLDAVLHAELRDDKREGVAGWTEVLSQDPTDPDVVALAQRHPAERMLFYFSRIVQMFARDRFQLHVSGLEKLPAQPPFILCSNHQSYLDPIIMSSFLPWPIFRELVSVGTSDIFGEGFMRRLARWLRVVVVDPDANLIPAMRAGAFGLRHGHVLILYPEGERSIDGPPKNFKKGAAILSIHLQVPIVPVAIEGFHDAWPRGRPFQKFAPLRISFGEPIFPPAETQASEEAYARLTVELRGRVVAMWEELRSAR